MKLKIYKLKDEYSKFPIEVYMYNPRDDTEIPEWFTEILKFKCVNENGDIEYQYYKDSEGNITYQIPKINGHLNVPRGSVILKNIGNGEVFSMKEKVFSILYERKLTIIERIINKVKNFKSGV